MNETLTKCAEEFFREYAQTAEYLKNMMNLLKMKMARKKTVKQ